MIIASGEPHPLCPAVVGTQSSLSARSHLSQMCRRVQRWAALQPQGAGALLHPRCELPQPLGARPMGFEGLTPGQR